MLQPRIEYNEAGFSLQDVQARPAQVVGCKLDGWVGPVPSEGFASHGFERKSAQLSVHSEPRTGTKKTHMGAAQINVPTFHLGKWNQRLKPRNPSS